MSTARRTGTERNGNPAGGLADRAVGEMADFADKAKRALGGAGDFAGDVGRNVARGGKKAGQFVVREVREHPLRTLAIGAAIGAVVAAVIMLRHRQEDEE